VSVITEVTPTYLSRIIAALNLNFGVVIVAELEGGVSSWAHTSWVLSQQIY
jgi:hypothetical protein